jgi:hypothetical protein
MRQLSSELLISPPLRCGKNQEFETDALRALLNCRIMPYELPIENQCDRLGDQYERRHIMHGMKEIIQEAASLPVEERVMVVDSLLRTLNPPDTEIEKDWVKVAKRRLAELRSGSVKAIPGDEVFMKIQERFDK